MSEYALPAPTTSTCPGKPRASRPAGNCSAASRTQAKTGFIGTQSYVEDPRAARGEVLGRPLAQPEDARGFADAEQSGAREERQRGRAAVEDRPEREGGERRPGQGQD